MSAKVWDTPAEEAVRDAVASDPYASRVGVTCEVAERVDDVIWGHGEGPLYPSQVDDFQREGYLGIPQLIEPKQAAELLREVNHVAENADPNADDVIVEPQGEAVRSLFRLHRTNEMIRDLCRFPLADLARQILGSEVYVHQSRINFKPAFRGKEFFWHSDFETWHVEDGMPRMRAVSMSISLSESNEFNGPLMVVGGSHWTYVRCVGETPDDHFKQSLRKQEFGVPSCEILRRLVEQGSGIAAPKGGPGSALLFDCNTMHGSVANLSPYPRTNLFVVFNSVKNELQAPFGGTPPRPEFLGERDVLPVSHL